MRTLFLLVFYCNSFFVYAQNTPLEASYHFSKALMEKDSKALQSILHEHLSYGHSNGWVEDKETLIRNNADGTLIYLQIQVDSSSLIQEQYSRSATVRYKAKHQVQLRGKILDLELYVAQYWIKKKGKWKLIFRQSAKL